MQKVLIIIIVLLVLVGGGYYLVSSGTISPDALTDANAGENIENETGAGDASEPVARVNGEEITRGQLQSTQQQLAAGQGQDISSLDASAQAQLQQQALDALIAQALLRQAAEEAGASASQTDIDAQLESITAQFDSDQAMQDALSAQGTTEAQLREQISRDLTMQAYVSQTLDTEPASATDEEIQALYDQFTANSSGEDTPSLEELRPQLEAAVQQQKQQQQLQQLIQQLRTQGEVEVLI